MNDVLDFVIGLALVGAVIAAGLFAAGVLISYLVLVVAVFLAAAVCLGLQSLLRRAWRGLRRRA